MYPIGLKAEGLATGFSRDLGELFEGFRDVKKPIQTRKGRQVHLERKLANPKS